MRVKTIVDEDFVNYAKPSMFIGTISCAGKCCLEANIPLSVCQNDGWRTNAPINLSDLAIYERYASNPITKAIVIGGLEPFEQVPEILRLVRHIRIDQNCLDDIVIYTGYYEEEILVTVEALSRFPNIIIKYGRYIPDEIGRFDEVLGVSLSSDNQYAVKIS